MPIKKLDQFEVFEEKVNDKGETVFRVEWKRVEAEVNEIVDKINEIIDVVNKG